MSFDVKIGQQLRTATGSEYRKENAIYSIT
jgi:hypothetical protein